MKNLSITSCRSKKFKNLHLSVYESLSDYYSHITSDASKNIKCIRKIRQHLEKHSNKLSTVEAEMLLLIDKMFIDEDKTIEHSCSHDNGDWSNVKLMVEKNISYNRANKRTNTIEDMKEFELLFDSIALNAKLSILSR